MPQLQEGVALMSSKYFRALTRVVAFMLVLGGYRDPEIAARLRIDFHHYLNESDHAPFTASALRSKPSFRLTRTNSLIRFSSSMNTFLKELALCAASPSTIGPVICQ
jgi:hypothetical protein